MGDNAERRLSALLATIHGSSYEFEAGTERACAFAADRIAALEAELAEARERIAELEAEQDSLRAQLRTALGWDQPQACRRCGRDVPKARRCYAIPTCHECLPPPPPLETFTLEPDDGSAEDT